MGNYNGEISSPVDIEADVAYVLGLSNYDLGYLCSNSHGKINKESRYKPVAFKSDEQIDFYDYMEVNWGYRIPDSHMSLSSYVSAMLGMYSPDEWAAPSEINTQPIRNGWYYVPPYGGDNSPYRLTDFIGYNHRASGIFGTFVLSTSVVTQNTNSLTVTLNFGNFKFAEFSTLQNAVFGVAITGANGTNRKCKTSSLITQDAQSVSITFGITEMSSLFGGNAGTYYVIPFATTQPQTNLTTTDILSVISLPIGYQTVTYKFETPTLAALQFGATNTEYWIGGQLVHGISVKNLGASSVTVRPADIKWRITVYDSSGSYIRFSMDAGAFVDFTYFAQTFSPFSLAAGATYNMTCPYPYSAPWGISGYDPPFQLRFEFYYPNSSGETVYLNTSTVNITEKIVPT